MTDEDFQILSKFGKRLEKLRKAQKLSYRQLALESDLDHSQITKIEKAERMPSLPILLKLAKGLKMTVSELLTGF